METDLKYLKDLLDSLKNTYALKVEELNKSGKTPIAKTLGKLKNIETKLEMFEAAIIKAQPFTDFRKGFDENYAEIFDDILSI